MFVPVHLICCYLEPGNKQKTDGDIERILYLIDSILARLPQSKLIVVRDFNERLQTYCNERDLRQLFQEICQPLIKEASLTKHSQTWK